MPLTVAVDASAASPGGGVSYLAQQLPALANLGVKTVVFARRETVDILVPILPSAEFVLVPGRSLAARLRYVHFRMAREARNRGAQVLYCPGSTAPLISVLPTVLCIQNPHLFASDAPRSLWITCLRGVAWLSALRANQVIQISRSMDNEFRRSSALNVPSTVILSGPGNLSLDGSAVALEPRRPYILAVSNIRVYKRHDLVIAAYASQPELRDNYDLIIAGGAETPGALADLQREVLRHDLTPGQVVFVGFVSGERLAALYRSASLYVSASEREAFPLTPAEALLNDLPVVLTDISSFRELYGDLAMFAPAGQATAFGEAMVAAIRRGPRPGQSNSVRDLFSWRRNARELAAVLAHAAADTRLGWRGARSRIRWRRLPVLVRVIVGSRSDAHSNGPSRPHVQ
jgi:glycosyltransferase involved in cell wall biosynthesis